jgi:phospholipid N-methyltransferase
MKNKKPKNNVFKFLNQSIRHFKEIGAIAPDSPPCIDTLVNTIPFASAELIVEYGAGSGAVTCEILRRKEPESTFICFEKNNSFYNFLRKNVAGPNFFIIHDDVFNSRNILFLKFGLHLGSVDCIISTLPWSLLKFDDLLKNVVIPLLKDDGIFIQYMYTSSVLKGDVLRPILDRYFSKIDFEFVFFNIPPVLVYACRVRKKNNDLELSA